MMAYQLKATIVKLCKKVFWDGWGSDRSKCKELLSELRKVMMVENRRRTCEVRGARAGALFHQTQNCQEYLAPHPHTSYLSFFYTIAL